MQPFGLTPTGQPAHLFTLQNRAGLRADISNYGGTVVRLFTPDRDGRLADVVLGFNSAEAYAGHASYFGATIGRHGNRIANGRFVLDGRTYQLATNNSPGGQPCHLHGGPRGFDKVLWQAEPSATATGPALRLRYRSADGEEGYPGNLEVSVIFTVTDDNTLRIAYTASTDRATPVNLTNHSYFNLAGEGSGDVLAHELTLRAPAFTPVNAGLIPTGEITPVAGTPFDFQTAQPIGARIERDDEQLTFAGGYDHNFVLSGPNDGVDPVATVHEPTSGRVLEVFTTEPGIQFYSGNFLDGSLKGKSGRRYDRRSGFCLETQHFPDAVNHPHFPSTILRPHTVLQSTTAYRFSAK